MIAPEVEKLLQETIFPDLEDGRPNWDKPHTESVVHYVKEVVRNANEFDLDADVLVIVAYAHDWGYAGLFKHGEYVGNADISKVKEIHAKLSAKKISVLLEDQAFDFLSLEQKQRITHLVRIHDHVEDLKDTDALVFMEADTLGQLDVTRVAPTLTQADNKKYMEKTKRNRMSRFITPFGKQKAEELFAQRLQYYTDAS